MAVEQRALGFPDSAGTSGLSFLGSCGAKGPGILGGMGADGSGFLDGFHCLRIVSMKLHAQLPNYFLPTDVDG